MTIQQMENQMNLGKSFNKAAIKNSWRRNKNKLILWFMLFLMLLGGVVESDLDLFVICVALFAVFIYSIISLYQDLSKEKAKHQEKMQKLETKLTGKQK